MPTRKVPQTGLHATVGEKHLEVRQSSGGDPWEWKVRSVVSRVVTSRGTAASLEHGQSQAARSARLTGKIDWSPMPAAG